MRVAYTVGISKCPPTYFTVQHAELMDNDAALFGLVLEKHDASISIPFKAAVPSIGGRLPFRMREYLEPAFLPHLSNMIRRWHPDIIHQHFGVWSRPAARAARKSGIPMVVTLHGFDVFLRLAPPSTLMQRWHHLNFDTATSTAAKVLPVSKFLADKAAQAGVKKKKIHVHYQGINTDFFTPPSQPVENEVPTILHVGAISEAKGIPRLLAASALIEDEFPHQLQLVGAGPLVGFVKDFARSHPQVHYLGSQSRLGVREAMRAADIFVLATEKNGNREEAAGLVTLEAQARATPVLVNRSGGAPEMLVDGETGLTAQRGNASDMAAQLRVLLSMSAAERADMGTRGRNFVVKERSLARSCAQLEEIYQALTAN